MTHTPSDPEDTAGEETPEISAQRLRAAIGAIETLALNLRTIRRGNFPPAAKNRIREILRLSDEARSVLSHELAARESPRGSEPGNGDVPMSA